LLLRENEKSPPKFSQLSIAPTATISIIAGKLVAWHRPIATCAYLQKTLAGSHIDLHQIHFMACGPRRAR
jgi:hypothetical protein